MFERRIPEHAGRASDARIGRLIPHFDAPLVLTDGATATGDDADLASTYRAYAQIARRYDLPIQLSTPPHRADAAVVALLRESANPAKLIVAGAIGPSNVNVGAVAAQLVKGGVDLLYAVGFATMTELLVIAKMLAITAHPFAMALAVRADGALLDGPSLCDAITQLDDDADARPWHYLIACESPAHATTALESLFRSAPPLAHRVVGVEVTGTPRSDRDCAMDLRDCAEHFGLSVLGCGSASVLEALAALNVA